MRSPADCLVCSLFDGDGNRMTPTHAVKNGVRYCYYVSRPLITNIRRYAELGSVRLHAGEQTPLASAGSGVARGGVTLEARGFGAVCLANGTREGTGWR